MITAIVIPVDLAEPIRLEQLDREDFNAYRRLVGGSLEVVTLDRPPASLYLNDEGKLLHLPVNARATALLWVHNSLYRGRDIVVGQAFIVGPANRLGDDKTAPQDLIDLLLRTSRYRVQVLADQNQLWSGNQRVFDDWLAAYLHAVQLAARSRTVKEVRVVPELDEKLRETWYRLGLESLSVRHASDPPFTRDSFMGCYSIEELEQRIGHGNWSVGTAFYYRDLCFINQVDGGDEWLTIRHGIAFESITCGRIIEHGEFASVVHRLLAANKEECQRLEY